VARITLELEPEVANQLWLPKVDRAGGAMDGKQNMAVEVRCRTVNFVAVRDETKDFPAS
jgi:hypothetical protein